jgi:hypothetical protein
MRKRENWTVVRETALVEVGSRRISSVLKVPRQWLLILLVIRIK